MDNLASSDWVNTVRCSRCGESVPRDHTVVRAEHGRLCWFCYSELDDAEDDDWYDDDSDYDDWDN